MYLFRYINISEEEIKKVKEVKNIMKDWKTMFRLEKNAFRKQKTYKNSSKSEI